MAAPKVEAVEHDDGSVSIGVKVDGGYVPFVKLDAARIRQLAQASGNAPAAGGEHDNGGEG